MPPPRPRSTRSAVSAPIRPREAELRKAKDDLLNSFIFNYDSPEKVLGQQVTLAVYGYPPDFLERYRAGIEKVTSADVGACRAEVRAA